MEITTLRISHLQLILWVLISGILPVYAQKPGEFENLFEAIYSKEIPAPLEYKLWNCEEISGSVFMTYVHPKKGNHLFFKVNSDGEIKMIGEITPEKSEFRMTLAVMKDRTYSAFFTTDTKSRSNCLYLQEFQFEGARFISEPTEVDCLRGDDYNVEFVNNFASYKVSPDGSKLLIFYKLSDFKNRTQRFRFCVFNSALDLLWKKDVVMELNGTKLRIGNRDWTAAEGFSGNNSNPEAIKIDDLGDVYFWSTGLIRHRGEMPSIYITKVTGNGEESKKIEVDGTIVMSNINMNDFSLKPTSDGVFIQGHVESNGKSQSTRFPNRGLVCGAWNSNGLHYEAYPYSYELTMEAMNESQRNRSAGYRKANRPVGWMPWPPQESWSKEKNSTKDCT